MHMWTSSPDSGAYCRRTLSWFSTKCVVRSTLLVNAFAFFHFFHENRPMPSAAEWEKKNYSSYGLVAVNSGGEGAQVEKVSHAQATKLLCGLGEGIHRM